MQPDLLTVIISALVGGGLFTGAAQLYQAIAQRKKAPADINLTVLGGAEKALLVMKQALDDAEERIIQLKTEMAEERQHHRTQVAAKDQEILNLQTNIETLRTQFNALAAQLDRIQTEVQAVQDGENDLQE